MKLIVPLILIISAIIGGYLVIIPLYGEVQVLSADTVQYKAAIKKGEEFNELISKLIAQRQDLPDEDVDRLVKMIPDNVDNVRLIIEIDEIAKKYSTGIRNIRVGDSKQTSTDRTKRVDNSSGAITLGFGVQMPYEKFALFLKDLESNLRLADITALSFIPTDIGNSYDFNLTLRTYWLKSTQN